MQNVQHYQETENRLLCFKATLESHHNKDSRKHNSQKQHGRVTAIVLAGEKDACRLEEKIDCAVTNFAGILIPVKMQFFGGEIGIGNYGND